MYSDSALRILIDGEVAGVGKTMSNQSRISTMSSQEILDLKRDIYLKNVISINYGEYAWGQISDQIKWRSSDSSVASINYRQGSLYENINNYAYVSYRPATEFILSGLRDGTTEITATHAATGLSKAVNINVETLKDKLYLFQIYPQAVTTVVYTNGNGQQKTVTTNETGQMAIYETSGLQGFIYMQSSFDGKEYRGTIHRDRLVSSEKDSTKLQLYPENNVKLREVAIAELYFKRPDGTPYSGDITLRGGVYKNGKYCPEAQLNNQSGAVDQTIALGPDGRLVVKMDPSQFWTDSDLETLTPQDQMEFLYEVRFADDAFYPRQLRVSGNMNIYDSVRFGTGIVSLKAVPPGEGSKPFVEAQSVGYEGTIEKDVTNFAGKIGPGQSWDTVTLTTRVFWWGEASDDAQGLHNLKFEDQYGVIPSGQSHAIDQYPFASMKSSVQTFVIDRNVMANWLKPFEIRNMNLVVIDGNGNQYRKIPMLFRIINMLDTAPIEDDNSLTLLLEKLTKVSSANSKDMNISDALIGAGIKLLSKQGIDTQMFGMMLRPTEDPTVFKALIFLDVGNMSNDNVTGVYSDDRSGGDLDYTPSLKEIQQMSKGEYKKKSKELLKKNKSQTKAERARELSYTLGGHMEAEVFYDEEKGKWEIQVINGGFNAGGGVNYKWNYNTFVGPVPVTGQLGLGVTLEVIFKVAIQRGEEIKIEYDEDAVNDYLTTLRLYGYFKAFAGFGCDYTVAALKIGLFGQINIDSQFAFLNQPYISDTAIKGQLLKIRGKVGIEFVAKFTFVSYEKILASKAFDITEQKWNDWDEIQTYWKESGKGSSSRTKPEGIAPLMLPEGAGLVPVAERSILEERDYLDKYDRVWGPAPISGKMMLLALDPESEVKDLQTNAYPYSNPVITDDGQIMVYISDADSTSVEDTEVRWTQLVGGSYPDGSPIDPGAASFGDSQLKIGGTGDFAAAAWVRQSEGLKKEAGEEVTYSDVALMSNSTEIMVSLYKNGSWTTNRLTENASSDLAPVVAVSGERVLVAWRSVYAPDASDPLNFSVQDNILYRIYENGVWSQPATLYNGTSGSVKGMDAAMLPDGTAAVAYAIDTIGTDFVAGDGTEGVDSGMEAVFAIVDMSGEVEANVRLTNDRYLDQNPQITTATLEDGHKWFVMGWHSVHDSDGLVVNDIRLCAFNGSGALRANFMDSISSINDHADVNITPTFRFAKNAENIEDLSIVWSESANSGTVDASSSNADKDVLKAVRFRSDGGRIYITSPLDVAQMPDYTLINHFDAYNTSDNSIKAVILGTRYDAGYEPTGLIEEGTGEELLVAAPLSGLYTAEEAFQNSLDVKSAIVDYSGVIRGMRIPVQFTVLNTGMEPVNSITIQIGENTQQYSGLYLQPNSEMTMTGYYDIPADKVINPVYTVTAGFDSNIPGMAKESSVSDTLYLAIPDVGISQLFTVSEDKGKRVMQMSLYNYSDVQLAGSDRLVRVGFYSDPDCTQPAREVAGQEADQPLTINPSDYGLIDEGAFTKQFTFDIAAYVGEGKEIPSGGVQLYAKTWIEEQVDPLADPVVTEEIMEYYAGNNYKPILFESLLLRHDNQPVTLSTLQTNESGSTNAVITIRNNSLVNVSSGNLVASLLDKDGNILETHQSYAPEAINAGLISLTGEETDQRSFAFTQVGASVMVSYSSAILDAENNANLDTLSITGIRFKLLEGVTQYSVNTRDLTETYVSAVTEDPKAKVILNGSELPMYNQRIPLFYGTNTLSIKVLAADNLTAKTYTIVINNVDSSKVPVSSDSDSTDSDMNGTVYKPGIMPANGEALISLSSQAVSQLIAGAITNKAREIVIAPEILGDASLMRLEVAGGDLSRLASITDASVRIETPIFTITLDHTALSSLAALGAGRISLVLEKKEDRYGLVIMADGKVVEHTDGGVLASIPAKNASNATVARRIRTNGSLDIIRYSIAKKGMLLVPLQGSTIFDIVDIKKELNDIQNHSLRNSIDFVVSRGLLNGTGKYTFSPDMAMTRGMLVTVLGKLCDADINGLNLPRFRDVSANAFYAPYVGWAAHNGISAGVGGGRFAPEEAITREQLVTMLAKFIQYSGFTLNENLPDQPPFADSAQTSSYAVQAVTLMKKAGIIFEEDNLFHPKGPATRAEVAQVLEMFIRNIIR